MPCGDTMQLLGGMKSKTMRPIGMTVFPRPSQRSLSSVGPVTAPFRPLALTSGQGRFSSMTPKRWTPQSRAFSVLACSTSGLLPWVDAISPTAFSLASVGTAGKGCAIHALTAATGTWTGLASWILVSMAFHMHGKLGGIFNFLSPAGPIQA